MVRRARRVPPVAGRVRGGAVVVVVAKATRLERAAGARPAVVVARRRGPAGVGVEAGRPGRTVAAPKVVVVVDGRLSSHV